MSNSSSTPPLWNQSVALENVGGDPSDLKDLLQMWIEQVPTLLAEIESAITGLEPDRLHLAAHTLKSSLQLFGMDACGEIAEALEVAGRTGQLHSGEQRGHQLSQLIQAAQVEVRAYLASR